MHIFVVDNATGSRAFAPFPAGTFSNGTRWKWRLGIARRSLVLRWVFLMCKISGAKLQIYVVFPHVESSTAPSVRECNASAAGHGAEQAVRERPRNPNRKRLQRKSSSFRRLSGPRRIVRGVEKGVEHQSHQHRGVPPFEAGSIKARLHSS